jgi:hypothetical protein
MKKELGKWSMDIAKYVLTAVILAKVFGDANDNTNLFIIGIITVIVTLSAGLYLVKEPKDKLKKRKKKK